MSSLEYLVHIISRFLGLVSGLTIMFFSFSSAFIKDWIIEKFTQWGVGSPPVLYEYLMIVSFFFGLLLTINSLKGKK